MTYLVTLGDAVNWGQGLLREHKFSDIVFRELLKAHPGLEHHRLAHSGAIIGPGAFLVRQKGDGEVPIGYPTILDQVDAFAGDPLDVAVVLVNGGINDVDIRNVLSPWVPLSTLHDLTIEHCFDSMRLLLRAVCNRFANPATQIVLTPYYPVLSRFSNPIGVPLMLANEGLAPPAGVETAVGLQAVVERCTQFWENSHDFFLAAMRDVNGSLPDARVRFADPGFTEHNAAFADDAWLFGLRRDGSAEDEVVEQRVVSCNAAIQVVDTLARKQCYCASAGHPNRAGARKYADAILSVLGLA